MRAKRARKGRSFLGKWDQNTPKSTMYHRFCMITRCFLFFFPQERPLAPFGRPPPRLQGLRGCLGRHCASRTLGGSESYRKRYQRYIKWYNWKKICTGVLKRSIFQLHFLENRKFRAATLTLLQFNLQKANAHLKTNSWFGKNKTQSSSLFGKNMPRYTPSNPLHFKFFRGRPPGPSCNELGDNMLI